MSDAPQNATTQHTHEWPAWADKFLDVLSKHGVVSRAALEVGVDRRTPYRLRKSDLEFAAAWDEAEYAGAETLVAEAYRRAVEGWEEPVYQGGEEVGKVRKYSDTMLSILLKSKQPDKFKDRVNQEVTGKDGGAITLTVKYEDKP